VEVQLLMFTSKKDLLRSHIIDIVRTQTGFSFLGFINFNRYNFRNDTRISQWFKENVHIENRWRGGRYKPDQLNEEQNKTPWEQFAETVRTDPEVMKYNIVPISVLIRDQKKNELMNRAISDYYAEMARPIKTEVDDKSCYTKCLSSEWNDNNVDSLINKCQKSVSCFAANVGIEPAQCIAKCF